MGWLAGQTGCCARRVAHHRTRRNTNERAAAHWHRRPLPASHRNLCVWHRSRIPTRRHSLLKRRMESFCWNTICAWVGRQGNVRAAGGMGCAIISVVGGWARVWFRGERPGREELGDSNPSAGKQSAALLAKGAGEKT